MIMEDKKLQVSFRGKRSKHVHKINCIVLIKEMGLARFNGEGGRSRMGQLML